VCDLDFARDLDFVRALDFMRDLDFVRALECNINLSRGDRKNMVLMFLRVFILHLFILYI
jgi:hypothetical protein